MISSHSASGYDGELTFLGDQGRLQLGPPDLALFEHAGLQIGAHGQGAILLGSSLDAFAEVGVAGHEGLSDIRGFAGKLEHVPGDALPV